MVRFGCSQSSKTVAISTKAQGSSGIVTVHSYPKLTLTPAMLSLYNSMQIQLNN